MKRYLKMAFDILSSRQLLLWLIILWIGYYLTASVWWKEAFGHFVMSLKKNPVSQALYMMFVINLLIRVVRRLKEGHLNAIRNGPVLLGIIIFMLGFFLSILTRDVDYAILGEGQGYSPPWEGYTLFVERVASPLKERYLDIEPEKGFLRYEPVVSLSDGSSRWEVRPYPPRRIGRTYFHILDFGIAPGIRLTEGRRILQEGYMILRLLPPGNQDYFEIEPYPYRFYIKLAPERFIEKGNLIGRSYNLLKPRYDLRVMKGEETMAKGISDSRIEFGGFSLELFGPVPWVRMEVVRDMGLPLIVAGILLILIGLPIRLAVTLLKGRGDNRGS